MHNSNHGGVVRIFVCRPFTSRQNINYITLAIQYSGKFSHGANFSRFSRMHVNAKISTKELWNSKMPLHCYFRISVDLHLVLASLHDEHSMRLGKYKQQKDCCGDHARLHGFLLRQWRKATRDSWATVLSEEINVLPEGSWRPGQFFIDVKTRQRSVTLKGVVNCRVMLTRK